MATRAKYPTLHTFPDGSRLVRHENGTLYHHSRGKNGTGRQTTGRQALAEAIAVVRKWEITAARVGAMHAAEFVTFDEVAEHYRQWLVRNGKNGTQVRVLDMLGRFFGPMPASLINASKTEEYQEWRRAGHGTRYRVQWVKRDRQRAGASDATLYREISTLQRVLSWAVTNDYLPTSTKTAFPKGPNAVAREVFLEQDEIEDLLARAAATSAGTGCLSRIHRFVWLALFTGARSEALEELEWSQVDFKRGVIQLQKAGTRVTKKIRAPVPILDELLPVLVRAHAEAENKFVLGGTEIRHAWETFVATTPYRADRDLHIHDLRRSFFTMLVTNGMPFADISLIYGISLAVLMKHYAKRASNLGSRAQGFVPVKAAPRLQVVSVR